MDEHSLERQVQSLVDRDVIRELSHRYALAIDSRDLDGRSAGEGAGHEPSVPGVLRRVRLEATSLTAPSPPDTHLPERCRRSR